MCSIPKSSLVFFVLFPRLPKHCPASDYLFVVISLRYYNKALSTVPEMNVFNYWHYYSLSICFQKPVESPPSLVSLLHTINWWHRSQYLRPHIFPFTTALSRSLSHSKCTACRLCTGRRGADTTYSMNKPDMASALLQLGVHLLFHMVSYPSKRKGQHNAT